MVSFLGFRLDVDVLYRIRKVGGRNRENPLCTADFLSVRIFIAHPVEIYGLCTTKVYIETDCKHKP